MLGLVGAMLSVILVAGFVLFYLRTVVDHLIRQGDARGLGLDRADADTAAD